MVKNLPAEAGDAGDLGLFNPWVGKVLWRWKWQPTPVFLPGEFYGQRSPVNYSPWGCKASDRTEHTDAQQFIRVGNFFLIPLSRSA